MLKSNAARTIVGVLGNLISCGIFLSPAPTFVEIYKKKKVEHFSPIPYLVALVNCMLWVFYGLPIVSPGSILVSTLNAGGILFDCVYLTIFIKYAPIKLRRTVLKILAGEVAFVAAVVVVVLFTMHTHDRRSMVVGIFALVFCVCMYASPLSAMMIVIQTKSVKYMPFWLSLTAFLNGVCWTAYALIDFDIYLLIPNSLGVILSLLQLVLYAFYFRSKPIEEEEKEKDEEKEMERIELASPEALSTEEIQYKV